MEIKQKIFDFFDEIPTAPHHRYRSWEHCYNYFREVSPGKLVEDKKHAALQLGFYLASWGMYRGSSFLLQCAYTVHEEVMEVLANNRYKPLWEYEYGSSEDDMHLKSLIFDATTAIKEAYRPFVNEKPQQPTDTLITKIILGTFGSLPACDRYFIEGFKSKGYRFSYLNEKFIDRIGLFSRENLVELRDVQRGIKTKSGIYYPLMKLVDMYFWQIGYEIDKSKAK